MIALVLMFSFGDCIRASDRASVSVSVRVRVKVSVSGSACALVLLLLVHLVTVRASDSVGEC